MSVRTHALAMAGVAVAVATPVRAFHSGGVAECVGCHSMHSPAVNAAFLLSGSDQSSTCLGCHERAGDTGPFGHHVSTAAADLGPGSSPLQRTPGGDFGWLRKTYSWAYTSGGQTITETEPGHHHGHNVIAADHGYAADDSNAVAPGGTFPSNQLSCVSCHDPHGKYRRLQSGTISTTGAPIKASGSYSAAENEPSAAGSVGVYRLLAGSGYTKASATFTGVPAAKAPSTYNQSEAVSQVRIAYGHAITGGHQTWSSWCATCHPGMHSSGNYVHPVDRALGGRIGSIYNSYVRSGQLNGTQATAFSSLVPFITSTASYPTLAGLAGNDSPTYSGPGGADRLSCLSCHRAHASAFPWALRWQIESEFITVAGSYVGVDNPSLTDPDAPDYHRGRTMAENQAGYYDRPASRFATWQRVLCNKCHAKD